MSLKLLVLASRPHLLMWGHDPCRLTKSPWYTQEVCSNDTKLLGGSRVTVSRWMQLLLWTSRTAADGQQVGCRRTQPCFLDVRNKPHETFQQLQPSPRRLLKSLSVTSSLRFCSANRLKAISTKCPAADRRLSSLSNWTEPLQSCFQQHEKAF